MLLLISPCAWRRTLITPSNTLNERVHLLPVFWYMSVANGPRTGVPDTMAAGHSHWGRQVSGQGETPVPHLPYMRGVRSLGQRDSRERPKQGACGCLQVMLSSAYHVLCFGDVCVFHCGGNKEMLETIFPLCHSVLARNSGGRIRPAAALWGYGCS